MTPPMDGTADEVVERKFLIATQEHGLQMVRGWELTRSLPGLALHRPFQKETHWRISHIPSGRCLDENLTFATATEATQFMAWLVSGAPLTPEQRPLAIDWTLSMEELQRRHPALRRDIKARTRRWLDRRRRRDERRRERVLDGRDVARAVGMLLLVVGLTGCSEHAEIRGRCAARLAWARTWEDSVKVAESVYSTVADTYRCSEVIAPAVNLLAGGDSILVPRGRR